MIPSPDTIYSWRCGDWIWANLLHCCWGWGRWHSNSLCRGYQWHYWKQDLHSGLPDQWWCCNGYDLTKLFHMTRSFLPASMHELSLSSLHTHTAPMDYVAVPATSWTFTALEQFTPQCFSITIEDDDVAEDPEECFNVTLSDPGSQANLILMPQMATVCIIDNDCMFTYKTMHACS